ncbi:MAG: hypothetical protein SVU32_07690 [Candidatus Nanohaloarchaea archaeon]|nr:hypothetical protein [Candidatus Nanohaloarchaea archaeon]
MSVNNQTDDEVEEASNLEDRLEQLEHYKEAFEAESQWTHQKRKEMREKLQQQADKIDELQDQQERHREIIDRLRSKVGQMKKSQIAFVRSMSDKQHRILQELLRMEDGVSNKTQQELADELDVDETYISHQKSKFKDHDLL